LGPGDAARKVHEGGATRAGKVDRKITEGNMPSAYGAAGDCGEDGGSNSSRPGGHDTFSFEAKEADADLSINIDLNQINKAGLDKKYELRGSMGSFKGTTAM
jgi:hypothetical protein